METINKYYKIAGSVYKNELTQAEFMTAYNDLKAGEAEIKAALQTKSVKLLKSIVSQLGGWVSSTDKKDYLINKVFDNLVDCFLIGRPVSYFVGEDTHDAVREKMISGTTQADLDKFYTGRKAKKQAEEKALNNPETLAEFREFIAAKGKDSLTPEQLIKYEQLTADITLERQQREQEQKNTVSKIDVENVSFEIYPTKHSKTQEDIFTVLMLNRVSAEDFKTLSSKAKKMGGYYSRYTDKNAQPEIKAGFNFKSEADAAAFIGLKESNQSTQQQAEEKQEALKESAADRMRTRAAAIIEKAEGELSRDRRTNTHRQAAQASSSEDKARAEIVFAKKLILIADGMESGAIKYLHSLTNGKQLEQLESILRKGFYLRTKNLTYSERQKAEKNAFEDVNFIEYPFPTYGEGVINDILKSYADTAGMKKNISKIFDYCARRKNANGLVVVRDEAVINLLKATALKIRDEWSKNRILDGIKDFERIQKMGLTNEAILKTALRELASLTQGAQITAEQKEALELKELERSFIGKKIDGFFPTPEPLIETMFSMAKVFEGETILEPSAGLGHIAGAIKQQYPNNPLDVVEVNHSLCEALSKKGLNPINADFLQTSKKYDVIFMNPPFENGQDIAHVKHAFSLLNNGGRLVAIMAANKFKTDKNTVAFNEMVENYGYSNPNPEGSFKSAFNSTGVNTITVYLEKEVAEIDEPKTVEEPTTTNAEMICSGGQGEQLALFL